MKKILTYISAIAALLATSCSEEFNGMFESTAALTFDAECVDMETRSSGDPDYKENTITKVAWFFFSDAEGTQLLYPPITTTTKTLQFTEAQLNGEYANLKKTSYLYVVANYPGTIPATVTTLEDLKALPVSTPFTKTVKDGKDDVEVLDPANLNFVMDSYNADNKENKYLFKVSPLSVGDTRTITVPLSRLAVKIGAIFNIKKVVQTKDVFGNSETWTPVLTENEFDSYFMNALDAGYLDGEPVRRAESTSDNNIKDHYFSYGRNVAAVSQVSSDGDYYVWKNDTPFYTYPQTWNGEDNCEPYLKVIFPWMSDVKGSSEFHYKLVLHDPDDEANVFTLNRNCYYQVEATIEVLGGTENDYVVVEVKCSVANWADPGWLSGAGLNSARFFTVPIQEFDVYSQESFDIPVNTNGTAKVYIKHIEFKDYSGKETATVERDFTKPADTEDDPFTTSYTVPASTFSDYGDYAYTVRFDGSDKYNKKVVFEHELTDLYIVRDVTIYIEKDDDPTRNETVIIHHHPAIELKKQGAGDVFVNGRFARVANATFGIEYTNSQGTFKHSGNGDSGTRIDEYESTFRYNSRTWDRGGQLRYGTISRGTNVDNTISTNWYTTDITVTAFSTSNNYYMANGAKQLYKIGDPRVLARSVYPSWDLDDYLTGIEERQTTGWSAQTYYYESTLPWESKNSILICSQADNEHNMIAPHFLISSALNAMGSPYVTIEEAVKRAATYQEAGYPAGRWRLPTEAEVAFIVARQNDGTLPTLYAANTTYWTGSGRTFSTTTGSTNITFNTATSTEGHSCRLVYDLWYWGDTPMSPNQYHPNMHEH